MADKLDWLGKHLILLRCFTVSEAVEKENYKIPPHLAGLFAGENGVEKMAFKLAKAEKYKDACEILAYVAHKRAGVWWGYRCILSLLEELGVNPAEERDIDSIAASFEPTIPDFAKVKLPDPPDMSQLNATLDELKAKTKDMRKYADPAMMKTVDDAIALAFSEFKKVHGMDPIELVKKVGECIAADPFKIDPNSPVYKARDELRAKLQTVRKQTLDTIKAVIPPKVPAHEKKLRNNALLAVYRWIVAPDELNSKACLDMGNACPDTPAGLLSLSAFWAEGNLMPGGERVVPAPPGLSANGINQTLLMCALHKGGTRNVKERFEQYFNLGVNVLSGKENWTESLDAAKAPHELDAFSHAVNPSHLTETPPEEKAGDHPYKRWMPY
jgi:hypothetical protein